MPLSKKAAALESEPGCVLTGQQRCVHTFAVHTDSVWTLWAPGNFALIYSGGRDNCVYRYASLTLLLLLASVDAPHCLPLQRAVLFTLWKAICWHSHWKCLTAHCSVRWIMHAGGALFNRWLPGRTHVASRSTELLFQEQAPINKLQMSADGKRLWCATTSSSVRVWDVPPPDWGSGGGSGHHAPTSPRTPGRMCGRVFHAGPSPQVRQRQRFSVGELHLSPAWHSRNAGRFDAELCSDAGPSPEPSESSVQVEIRGVPPLVRFVTLADRRHVLTQDSQGQVALWDLACGAIVEQYGKVRLHPWHALPPSA